MSRSPVVSFLLSSVNPKFVNFSRPLLLSLTVGLISAHQSCTLHALFLLLSVHNMATAVLRSRQAVWSIMLMLVSRRFSRVRSLRCDCWHLRTHRIHDNVHQFTTYPQYFGPLWNIKEFVKNTRDQSSSDLVDVTMCLRRIGALVEGAGSEHADSYRINNRPVVNLEWCFPTLAFMSMDDETQGCFQSGKDEEPECGNCGRTFGQGGEYVEQMEADGPFTCNEFWEGRKDGQSCKGLPCVQANDEIDGVAWCKGAEEEALMMYETIPDICQKVNYAGNPNPFSTDWEVTTCTRADVGTALGVASGFAGYVEFGATALCIILLTAGGCLHTTKSFRKALSETLAHVDGDNDVLALQNKIRELEDRLNALAGAKVQVLQA
jgi:hypothetical protein